MLTVPECNLLYDKAKTRKDGVYTYKTCLYVVKDNSFIMFADYFGNIYSMHGSFVYQRGSCKSYDRKTVLLKYLKTL